MENNRLNYYFNSTLLFLWILKRECCWLLWGSIVACLLLHNLFIIFCRKTSIVELLEIYVESILWNTSFFLFVHKKIWIKTTLDMIAIFIESEMDIVSWTVPVEITWAHFLLKKFSHIFIMIYLWSLLLMTHVRPLSIITVLRQCFHYCKTSSLHALSQ